MPRTPSKVIRETVLRQDGEFDCKKIAALCGCHPHTARKHLEKMACASEVNRIGAGVYVRRGEKSGVVAGKIEIGKGFAGWGGWK